MLERSFVWSNKKLSRFQIAESNKEQQVKLAGCGINKVAVMGRCASQQHTLF